MFGEGLAQSHADRKRGTSHAGRNRLAQEALSLGCAWAAVQKFNAPHTTFFVNHFRLLSLGLKNLSIFPSFDKGLFLIAVRKSLFFLRLMPDMKIAQQNNKDEKPQSRDHQVPHLEIDRLFIAEAKAFHNIAE